jgi:hypothetical protein
MNRISHRRLIRFIWWFHSVLLLWWALCIIRSDSHTNICTVNINVGPGVNDVILYFFNLNVIINSMPNRINIVLFIKNSQLLKLRLKTPTIKSLFTKRPCYNNSALNFQKPQAFFFDPDRNVNCIKHCDWLKKLGQRWILITFLYC